MWWGRRGPAQRVACSALAFHRSQARIRTPALITVAFAASSSFRNVTGSPGASRRGLGFKPGVDPGLDRSEGDVFEKGRDDGIAVSAHQRDGCCTKRL
jgi:hypothetical protein